MQFLLSHMKLIQINDLSAQDIRSIWSLATKPSIPIKMSIGFIVIAAVITSDSNCLAFVSPNISLQAFLYSTSLMMSNFIILRMYLLIEE